MRSTFLSEENFTLHSTPSPIATEYCYHVAMSQMHSNISSGFHKTASCPDLCRSPLFTLCIWQFAINFQRQTLMMLQPSIYWLRPTLLAFLLCSLTRIVATQDACIPPYPGPRVITSVLVVKQTIHVITNVPKDTAFEVNPDLTISINNAPTNIDLITTYFSRHTSVLTMAG